MREYLLRVPEYVRDELRELLERSMRPMQLLLQSLMRWWELLP
jgi:hypothetical protein